MRSLMLAVAIFGALSLELAPTESGGILAADCTTDRECARQALELCQDGDLTMCAMPDLPDNAIRLACAEWPDALACR